MERGGFKLLSERLPRPTSQWLLALSVGLAVAVALSMTFAGDADAKKKGHGHKKHKHQSPQAAPTLTPPPALTPAPALIPAPAPPSPPSPPPPPPPPPPIAGSLDLSFSSDGKVTTDFGSGGDFVKSVAIQSDGKIVAAGGAGAFFINRQFALARYNTDGSLDTSFDTDGMVTTDFGGSSDANSVAIQSDGKIVAAGSADPGSDGDFALARYLGQ